MNGLLLLEIFVVSALVTYLLVAPSAEDSLIKSRALSIRRSVLHQRADGGVDDEEMQLPFRERVLRPAMTRMNRWMLANAPGRMQSGIQLKLMQAGNPLGLSQFLGVKAMLAGGMALAGFILAAPSLGEKTAVSVILMVILLVLGWQLPDFWLSRLVTGRRRAIEKALPDVLDLLSVSVEAGLGLDGAIQKVGEKFPEPTSGEFRELLKAIRLGTPRSDALRELADRTALGDMRSFTAAIIQAEQLGVAVSRVLRVQSEALRTRRKQRIEEQAMALPLKMLFPLIIFIFPTIFIVVLGPVVLQFVTTLGK